MTKAECEKLIDGYLRWLKEGLHVNELEGSCVVATPFLDRHNDEIEIYVERNNGGVLLTDDGYTMGDLAACGMSFDTDKRKAHLMAILNGFGVKQQGNELRVHATANDFPQKKHNLVQAMLAVNDMFVMGQEHVLSLFKEDVSLFFEMNNIPVFPDFKLSGRSGFDHKFDFGLGKTQKRPQRVVQAINNLTKDQATSYAFAVTDVKTMRSEPLQAFAWINDVEHPPTDENLSALRAYDVEPLLWSRRNDSLTALN
jgi:hypothetical protein